MRGATIAILSSSLIASGLAAQGPDVNIAALAATVAGPGSTLERTGRLVYWINDSLTWSATDYVRRTPLEILARRQGNCADLASVLRIMLDSLGIRSRWIREINVQPDKTPRRQKTAEEMVDGVAVRRNVTGAVGQAVPGVTSTAWQDIKSRFVDDPAGAVAAAEDMVRQALEERIRALRSEAAGACGPERDGEEPSTEAMRTRLRRCQAYCEQLAASMAH